MQCLIRPAAAAAFRFGFAAMTVLAAGVALSACGEGSARNPADGSIQVVATTTQIADLVRNVGGERVAVTQILKPDSDPHGFEPRPSDVIATADAALVFSNGGDLDPWAERLVSESGSAAKLVDLSSALPDPLAEPGHHAEQGHDHEADFDPHWWHDPRNVVSSIETIAERLAEADPEGRSEYDRHGRDYSRRVERLDRQIASCLKRIPAQRRKLVTDHEAFGYFANRYGLEVVGAVVPALTSQAQPSARDLSELAAEIESQGVTTIFPEVSLNPKLAEAIAGQTGIDASHTLYGDALGPADSDGATYLGMMAANARAIAAGLSAGKVRCRLDAAE